TALYIAGRPSSNYRRAAGTRTSVLADFFIGAHAVASGLPILTRDTGRYRSYFPDVALITPD
ncbi:type II toxin-antitoxin system VapC family toxin, partial [Rhodopseudomonas sp. B29]|uniref:type II toxin-antitoxin system VapC family toxin n=1 Tax=Rhodopseudomonas sp. B29 TaxID=95607 RepID=UPI0035E3D26F